MFKVLCKSCGHEQIVNKLENPAKMCEKCPKCSGNDIVIKFVKKEEK